jgi:UPF0755 protein
MVFRNAAVIKFYKHPFFILGCMMCLNLGCVKTEKETIKITITKIRTRTDLARKLAAAMQEPADLYTNFLTNNDSLKKIGRDTNTLMSAIIPNTYLVYKGSELKKVLKKIMDFEPVFWNPQRKEKAGKIQLTPHQVYTLASIVEEETNAGADKGKIASVYLNRLKKGMRLEADPTLKFALNDFELERVIQKHKEMTAASPYNTYTHTGLPPGPICTPSIQTIDAVLDAPETDFIFFVAQPNHSGLSNFTSDYNEHLKNAAVYRKYLDSIGIKKKISSAKQTL